MIDQPKENNKKIKIILISKLQIAILKDYHMKKGEGSMKYCLRLTGLCENS